MAPTSLQSLRSPRVSSAYTLQLGVDGLLVQVFESSIFYWDQNYACAAQRWSQDFIHNFVGTAFPKKPLLCNLYGTFCFYGSLFHYSNQKDESVVPPLLCFSVTSFAFGTKQEEGREEKRYWGSPHPVGATVHRSERKISFPQNFGSSGLLLTRLAPQDNSGQGIQENLEKERMAPNSQGTRLLPKASKQFWFFLRSAGFTGSSSWLYTSETRLWLSVFLIFIIRTIAASIWYCLSWNTLSVVLACSST